MNNLMQMGGTFQELEGDLHRLLDGEGRLPGHEPALVQKADLGAAFRFVHVVRGHKNRRTPAAQFVK